MAVAKSELDKLKKLVEQDHASVNEKDIYSVSLLHGIYSLQARYYVIFNRFNAQLRCCRPSRRRDTSILLHHPDKLNVLLLIERGADITLAAREGLTPVHVAAGIGHSDIFESIY